MCFFENASQMPDPKGTKRKIATIAHDHNVRLFLVCLLVTVILWIVLTLSASRSKRYTCPVKYVGYGKQEYVLLADSTLTFDIECSGFEHLHTLFWKETPEININLRKHGGKSLYIRDLSEQILSQLGFSEGRTINFLTDSLRLNFQKRMSKKVKVDISGIKLAFAEQYGVYGMPVVSPDSITFYGNLESLKKVNSVQVVDTQLTNLNRNRVCEIPLRPDWRRFAGVCPSQEKVKVTVNVERQTEVRYSVPLKFTCSDTSVHAKLYPSNVEITSRVAMRDYKSMSPDLFTAAVFYDVNEKKDTLPVFISEFPQFVHISKVEPKNVRYLIIK